MMSASSTHCNHAHVMLDIFFSIFRSVTFSLFLSVCTSGSFHVATAPIANSIRLTIEKKFFATAVVAAAEDEQEKKMKNSRVKTSTRNVHTFSFFFRCVPPSVPYAFMRKVYNADKARHEKY